MPMLKKLLEFIEEDAPYGDITSSIIEPDTLVAAKIYSKEACVLAGIEETVELMRYYKIDVKVLVGDGEEIDGESDICILKGDARGILLIERTVLNLLSRMSGIATLTRRLKKIIDEDGLGVKIAATRKTCPGLRYFDKRSVEIGGGYAHRMGLSDAILIKDNHIAVVELERAIASAKKKYFTKKIEVEVKTPEEALMAATLGADIVMLDNFQPDRIKKAEELLTKNKIRKEIILEASGNITPQNLLDYARSGVDVISLGFLTHSVRGIDFSLEITKVL
jgi:nicotinate-nucleotide pyrophosphorylase [carboxylating] (EC 2.4.2.19)